MPLLVIMNCLVLYIFKVIKATLANTIKIVQVRSADIGSCNAAQKLVHGWVIKIRIQSLVWKNSGLFLHVDLDGIFQEPILR